MKGLDLEQTAIVFKAIVDHAREGGSYRTLIYNQLGFGPEAYVPLFDAGGMIISNEFTLTDFAHEEECAIIEKQFNFNSFHRILWF